jgi:hypothetical protein
VAIPALGGRGVATGVDRGDTGADARAVPGCGRGCGIIASSEIF